jgi:hypothetical protein
MRSKILALLVAVALVATAALAACGGTTTAVSVKPAVVFRPFVWNINMDCAACHAARVKSMNDVTLLAYQHAAAGEKCTDCHQPAVLQESHKNITLAMPETPQKYPQPFCLDCHGSYEALIALTGTSTVFTTPEGKTISVIIRPPSSAVRVTRWNKGQIACRTGTDRPSYPEFAVNGRKACNKFFAKEAKIRKTE